MREGGRPRLIIDFQAERAVPKQSAECKPCAKVRVTDTPARRYITFFFPVPLPPCLISALASLAPVFPSFSAVLCCAVLCSACAALRWYLPYREAVSAGNTGEEVRQGRQGRAGQGKARRRQGPSPRKAGERRTGSQGKGWMDGMEWMRLTWKRVGSIKVCRNFTTRVS